LPVVAEMPALQREDENVIGREETAWFHQINS
jgi:hypothetical protein